MLDTALPLSISFRVMSNWSLKLAGGAVTRLVLFTSMNIACSGFGFSAKIELYVITPTLLSKVYHFIY